MPRRSTNPKRFLTALENTRVENAIRTAETKTSAEIRLAFIRHAWGDPHTKALQVFHDLGLTNTNARNAVLILLITANRELVIYGDKGIDRLVAEDLWQSACTEMISHFKEDEIAAGLTAGIEMIGEQLGVHFPYSRGKDENELPDEVAHVQ